MPNTKWPIKYKRSHRRLILVLRGGHLLPAGPQDSHLVAISLIWFKGLLPGVGGVLEDPWAQRREWSASQCVERRLKRPMALATLCIIRLQSCHHLDLDYSRKADMLKYLVSYLAIWESGELQVGPTGAGKSPKR